MNALRIYIAGGMSGYDNLNFDAFDAAERSLHYMGHETVNPANLDRDMGIDSSQYDSLTLVSDELRHTALRRDFAELVTCDAIALLPGWERSKGACAERFLSEQIGLGIYHLVPLIIPGEYSLVAETPAVLIGLAGYAQTGKDTTGAVLVEHYGFERLAFADALKRVSLGANPSYRGSLVGTEAGLRSIVQAHGWEYAKAQVPGVRQLLQNLGVAVREHLDPDAWVNAVLRHVRPGGRYVITDVRFPNEAAAIRDRGGLVVRVHRPGVTAVNAHVSETALDGFEFDHHVYNDGTLDKLGVRVGLLAEEAL